MVNRRTFLKYGGAAGAFALAGCTGNNSGGSGGSDGGSSSGGSDSSGGSGSGGSDSTGTPTPSETTTAGSAKKQLTKLHMLAPEASLESVPYQYGAQNGSWEQHGIDLSVELASFGKYTQQVPQGLSNIGPTAVPPAITLANKGASLTWLGQDLSLTNYMLVKSDSGIKTPKDVKGKTLGIPFDSSTTTYAYQALMQDAYSFDIFKDPKNTKSAAPPVLWKLFQKGDLDAIIEFAGFSIKGQVADDVDVIFDPVSYWKKNYGTIPPLAVKVAKPSWVKTNAKLAANYVAGYNDALASFRDNVDDALGKYGEQVGLSSDAEINVVKDRVKNKTQFAATDYTQKQADSNWKFVTLMKDAGVFDTLPDKDTTLTTNDELQAMVGGN
ncbi:MAG: ABC transporter substrate-binding protein [Salinigranum sp.]